MDETLERAKKELIQLNYLLDELKEIESTLNSIKNCNQIVINETIFGSTITTYLNNNSITYWHYFLKDLLIKNVKNRVFNSKMIIIEEPTPPDPDVEQNIKDCKKLRIIGWVILAISILAIIPDGFYISNGKKVAIILLIPIIISILGSIVLIFKSTQTIKDNNKKCDDYQNNLNKYNNFIKELVSIYDDKIEEKSKLIVDCINDFNNEKARKISLLSEYSNYLKNQIETIRANSVIPYHYTSNHETISILLNIIFSKRADSLKELINIYENDRKLNIIISEIQKSNQIFLSSTIASQEYNEYISNLIDNVHIDLKNNIIALSSLNKNYRLK